ncbi:MAG: thermonuclease family protein [Arenicellales bacterium]|nr:thermonuclease family protein [Arenicellales bacterium]
MTRQPPTVGNRTGKISQATQVAFFVFLWLSITSTSATGLRSEAIDRVIDGDTLVLVSGEVIRLAGINTPELGHEGRLAEPLAQAARAALQTLVEGIEAQVEDAVEPRDRHGRTLAYLFTPNGTSIQAALLRQGLASAVAISPNDAYLREYIAAEDAARRAGRGIWALPYYAPHPPDGARGGYQFVHGKASLIEMGEKWLAFSLSRQFVILVRRTDWQDHFNYLPRALDQAAVTVRGWVGKRKSRSVLVISHPFMLERCGVDPRRLCPAD